MRKFPNFLALRAFEAAARLGSYRKAAAELSVTHTVVSRHVRALESSLGVALLHSTPQGVVPTADGAGYAARIAAALDAIAQATLELAEPRSFPTLHVSCSPGFAVRWLAPRISDFMRDTPELEITIRPTDRPPALSAGESDVDIRYTDQASAGARALELIRPRVIPVAAPAWLAGQAPIRTLRDLLDATLVHEETHAHWRSWFNCAGLTVNDMPHGTRYWNAALALDAATMGHGIALAPEIIVSEAVRAGQLVEVLATEVVIHPYLFATRPERWDEDVIVRFRTWIERKLAA